MSVVECNRYRPRKVDTKRWLALYRMRNGTRSRRALVDRLRRVLYPRARKAGPTFPSIRPSRPDLPRFAV